MTDIIRLYRGDSEKIRKFDYYKTSSSSLAGRGFYLTDNEKIAHSYRLKGSEAAGLSNLLIDKDLENMNVAREETLTAYIVFQLKRDRHYKIANDPKKVEAAKVAYRPEFERLLEDGTITIRRYQPRKANNGFLFQAVYMPRDIGYVTSFDFPRKYLESNVVHIETSRPDPNLLDIAWENGCVRKVLYSRNQLFMQGDKVEFHEKDDFVKHALRHGITPNHFDCNKLGVLLDKQYGILGFEYKGGIRVGGLGTHRAFNLFNERYVNEHRTQRYR